MVHRADLHAVLMGSHVTAWVYDQAPRNLSPAEMLVALVLAEHANPDGGLTYPTVGRIVELSRLTERGVQGCLQALVRKGVIRKHLEANGPRPTVYCFHAFRATPEQRSGVASQPTPANPAGVANEDSNPNNELPPKPTPKKSRLPKDFELTEDRRTYAVDKGIPERAVSEVWEDFTLWGWGNGEQRLDWDLVWKGWVRREVKRNPRFNAREGINDDIVASSPDPEPREPTPIRPRTPDPPAKTPLVVPTFTVDGVGLTNRQVWAATLTEATRKGITPGDVDTWLRPAALVGQEGSTLVVSTRSTVARDRIAGRFGPQVRDALRTVVGATVELRAVTDGEWTGGETSPNGTVASGDVSAP